MRNVNRSAQNEAIQKSFSAKIPLKPCRTAKCTKDSMTAAAYMIWHANLLRGRKKNTEERQELKYKTYYLTF